MSSYKINETESPSITTQAKTSHHSVIVVDTTWTFNKLRQELGQCAIVLLFKSYKILKNQRMFRKNCSDRCFLPMTGR